MSKEEITNEQAEKEVDRFAKQIYNQIIELIQINQRELKKMIKESKGEYIDFHNGGIAFGNVIIHEINEKLKSKIGKKK